MSRETTKIAIHGVPRSGTSWLGEIFNSNENLTYKFQPLFSYALKGYLKSSSNDKDIERFFDLLQVESDHFLDQTEARVANRLPQFCKTKTPTHVAYKEVRYHHLLPGLLETRANVIFVFVIRSPFAVISSWLEAPREFRKDLGWKRLEEWRYAPKKNSNKPEEFNGYEKWKEATLMFLQLAQQHPNRVVLCHYEDLVRAPCEQTKNIFDKCGLEFTSQTESFLSPDDSPESDDSYSVFRKHSSNDKWKSTLEPEIIDLIRNDISNSVLNSFADRWSS